MTDACLCFTPNGEAGIFDRDGELTWSGYFKYHDETVNSLALDGKYFWCICPAEYCAIRYSCQNMQVDLRIGGKDATTFVKPTHISVGDGDIYVCSSTNKVRKIDGNDLTVSDYLTFEESVKQFLQVWEICHCRACKRYISSGKQSIKQKKQGFRPVFFFCNSYLGYYFSAHVLPLSVGNKCFGK